MGEKVDKFHYTSPYFPIFFEYALKTFLKKTHLWISILKYKMCISFVSVFYLFNYLHKRYFHHSWVIPVNPHHRVVNNQRGFPAWPPHLSCRLLQAIVAVGCNFCHTITLYFGRKLWRCIIVIIGMKVGIYEENKIWHFVV